MGLLANRKICGSPLFFDYGRLEDMKILITGGAGFIGGNFVHYWVKNHPGDEVVVLDKLTYAGNLATLEPIKNSITFIHGDIADPVTVDRAMEGCDVVVHFAAETHVDRSIDDPFVFSRTNVLGTHVLLEAARRHNVSRFHHISTDEVFGHIPLAEKWKFNEETKYRPSSAYSASKAGSDHLVNAYFTTYKLPITITNCANNFGPYLHPEKFIARSIIRLLDGKNIPIYTPGNQIRDWLYVGDHCRAIEMVLLRGRIGETYCVGGMTEEISNLEVAKMIAAGMGLPDSRIEMVTDRAGHDAKYAIDWTKINRELGWQPEFDFQTWLLKTIDWYKDNEAWWRPSVEATEQFYQQRGEKVLSPPTEGVTELVGSQTLAYNDTITAPVMAQKTAPIMRENDYIIETALPGVMIIERPTFADDRGFFRETFRKKHLEEHLGRQLEFLQANHSRSSKGTLRGIHIAPWDKLITVTGGEVQAVIVDTRPDSPTFGRSVSLHLTDKAPRSLFVPAGCGNSFLVLSEQADYTYLTTEYWAPGKEFNIAYNDPDLNIAWANSEPTLSEKDQTNPSLREVFPEKFSGSLAASASNILILGGKGNLGNQLAKLLPGALVWDRDDLDVTDPIAVTTKFNDLGQAKKIDTVINCTAFNDLDAAEENPGLAVTLNVTAPRMLAEAAKQHNLTFVHYSTGYVFSGEDGVNEHPETAMPNPNSVYAASKLAGEQAVQSVGGRYYILRTNVLFGPMGPGEAAKKSVVDVMYNIGKEKKKLRGIINEFSNFTYTPDLARATVELLQAKPPYGLYHMTNEGFGSWYDLSKAIFTLSGWQVLDSEPIGGLDALPERTIVIEKITGDQYPRAAKRPTSAVLQNTKLPTLRSWQEALKEYLTSI